eukprot:TRINITY_DN2279_c0_g1_i4.p1 TRINITY_DN2279_c0_g1~~TRINITY_DN2279_c0_g1_i4.p1  ORF type:complete len:342 (-),score=100.57 TRINITY_DN2279_c0_g1_i4:88-1113(-)
MLDRKTGRSRGFGFVVFARPEEAQRVVAQEDHFLDSRKLEVKYAVPKNEINACEDREAQARKIFVGGIATHVDEAQLFNYFNEKYGKVVECAIVRDKESRRSKGFGFVTFETEECITKVIADFYKHEIDGKWIECKRALIKEVGIAPPVNAVAQVSKHAHPFAPAFGFEGGQTTYAPYNASASYNYVGGYTAPQQPNMSYPVYKPQAQPESFYSTYSVPQMTPPMSVSEQHFVFSEVENVQPKSFLSSPPGLCKSDAKPRHASMSLDDLDTASTINSNQNEGAHSFANSTPEREKSKYASPRTSFQESKEKSESVRKGSDDEELLEIFAQTQQFRLPKWML